MSVTNEIIQTLSETVLSAWIVGFSLLLFSPTGKKHQKELFPQFDTLSISVCLFVVISNFHLHKEVLSTIISGAFVVYITCRVIYEWTDLRNRQ